MRNSTWEIQEIEATRCVNERTCNESSWREGNGNSECRRAYAHTLSTICWSISVCRWTRDTALLAPGSVGVLSVKTGSRDSLLRFAPARRWIQRTPQSGDGVVAEMEWKS